VDRDKDYGDSPHDAYFDSDDYKAVDYPHAADAASSKAVTALVKSYLAAAAAEDGSAGCSMIYSLFAESIPETLGEPPSGTPQLSGKTCAVVMTKLYRQMHGELAAEAASVRVAGVHVAERRGLVLLGLRGMGPHVIQVHLERGVWKINETVPIEAS
jgi:hypothetical protein